LSHCSFLVGYNFSLPPIFGAFARFLPANDGLGSFIVYRLVDAVEVSVLTIRQEDLAYVKLFFHFCKAYTEKRESRIFYYTYNI